ncbi:MAG: hypothetical protein QNJ58_03360 [Desulfobacterales bacterium]|nr:hypothetical protein [Desulfobacterales bacterium]
MENHIVTGIGCFAQPRKLSQVFLRVVEAYTLGHIRATDLVEGCNGLGSGSKKLIRRLIDGGPSGRRAVTGEIGDFKEYRRITGFYLAFKGNSLTLSIFARNRDRQQEIHSARLEKLTRFRQKRLN